MEVTEDTYQIYDRALHTEESAIIFAVDFCISLCYNVNPKGDKSDG